jgi:hypothetical protein
MPSVENQRSVADTMQAVTSGVNDFVRRFGRRLEGLQAKVEELEVQADLAGLELRDEMRGRLTLVENVYLAARSKLTTSEIESDEGLRYLLEALATDLRDACQAAQAVVERGRST